jgi:hypothetical protein
MDSLENTPLRWLDQMPLRNFINGSMEKNLITGTSDHYLPANSFSQNSGRKFSKEVVRDMLCSRQNITTAIVSGRVRRLLRVLEPLGIVSSQAHTVTLWVI